MEFFFDGKSDLYLEKEYVGTFLKSWDLLCGLKKKDNMKLQKRLQSWWGNHLANSLEQRKG